MRSGGWGSCAGTIARESPGGLKGAAVVQCAARFTSSVHSEIGTRTEQFIENISQSAFFVAFWLFGHGCHATAVNHNLIKPHPQGPDEADGVFPGSERASRD